MTPNQDATAHLIQIDPRMFADAAIDSETRDMNERLRQATSELPARWELPLEIERSMPPGGGIVSPILASAELRAEDRFIDGPGGPLLLRQIFPPAGTAVRGVYLHFHGGGFCLGSARGQDGMLESIARHAGVVAISVDYRLAPEHPLPAAAADGEAAAWWLVRNARETYGTDRIVIGGESAGAALSTFCALRLRDRHGYTALAGLNLSQGGYDLSLTPSMRQGHDTLILNLPTFKVHLSRFLTNFEPDDPVVSPLYADLRFLPPALFTIGTADPLLDDNLFMYMKWVAAGNTGELAVYPGGIHGFTFLSTQLSRRAAERSERFIATCIA
ncbi:alpha/beta hydrolase [Variovorax sp. EL159]|uniref:alpha/beta hydrolase n=1 Tax=Variovorax sp. EL159 TaxID=1566270 RepID=UPI00088DEC4F|nr:alpha/beta hydrolase [Variovorax sp. EL159]SCX72540.1 Acetyl esterase/lipase [Variovorax sp. EL159]